MPHVTEVARIENAFHPIAVACSAMFLCAVADWTANDYEQPPDAGKLLGHSETSAASFLSTADLEVDVEHEVQFISQCPDFTDAVESMARNCCSKTHGASHRLSRRPGQEPASAPKPQSIRFKPLPTS
jgi:hypothetical protein